MYSHEPNVAYDGTGDDLQSEAINFLKYGIDSTLFDSNDNVYCGAANPHSFQNMATVSPQELMIHSMASVPSSASIPALSPSEPLFSDVSTFTSPYLQDYEESPLLGTLSAATSPYISDNQQSQGYDFSLFPQEPSNNATTAVASASANNGMSASEIVIPRATETRKRSLGTASASASPMVGARPVGIRKKNSNRPLMALNPDPNDQAAVKRAKNTQAARESRQRKEETMKALQEQVEQLKAQLAASVAENAMLKAQINNNASINTLPAAQEELGLSDVDITALLSST